MNLSEAISILAAKKLDDVERRAHDSADACQLGIEALKRHLVYKTLGIWRFPSPLPGETK